LSEAQIATLLVREGLKALEANSYQMHLPFRLQTPPPPPPPPNVF
jgi:hypothetical protein